MMNRLFAALRKSFATGDFDAYWASVQQPGLEGGPSVEDAKRDYQVVVLLKEGLRFR